MRQMLFCFLLYLSVLVAAQPLPRPDIPFLENLPKPDGVAIPDIESLLSNLGGVNTQCQTRDSGSLDVASDPGKYMYKLDLPLPDKMPKTKQADFDGDYYELAARPIKATMLPGFKTPVYAYGSVNHEGTFSVPAPPIETKANREVKIKWMNELVDKNGDYVSHMFPIDQTLHWANPGCTGHLSDAYEGPIPLVTHFHGGRTNEWSDGHPDNWVLPNANNIPEDYRRQGPVWETFRDMSPYSDEWTDNSVVSDYMETKASHLWFHDHAVGTTRVSVHAGLVGNYFVRGGDREIEGLPAGQYELPLTIFDRSFNEDGTMWFPDGPLDTSGQTFDGPTWGQPTCNGAGPSDIHPIWNPGVDGNVILVNGAAWPVHEVYQACYRLRLLQASTAKAFQLYWGDGRSFTVIGSDHGFLNEAKEVQEIEFLNGERLDILVDFSDKNPGDEIELLHNAGDCEGQEWRHKIMKFVVKAGTGDAGSSCVVPQLPNDVDNENPGEPVRVRRIFLAASPSVSVVVPSSSLESGQTVGEQCGSWDPFPLSAGLTGFRMPLPNREGGIPMPGILFQLGNSPTNMQRYSDPITEYPPVGDVEVWEFINLGPGTHPIHVHEGAFTVIDRFEFAKPGEVIERQPWEDGLKDVVAVHAFGGTRIKVQFRRVGLYMMHCHILTHEDNDMMRPFCITEEDGTIPKTCLMHNDEWGDPCSSGSEESEAKETECNPEKDTGKFKCKKLVGQHKGKFKKGTATCKKNGSWNVDNCQSACECEEGQTIKCKNVKGFKGNREISCDGCNWKSGKCKT